MKKIKLELTWIGKNDKRKIEPRILLEDKEKNYGDQDTDNLLIHGDNLLALKSLEQKYAGKINCIYIDPPFNTGSAFEHYNDNLEHSTWLSLMNERFKLFHKLLAEDGAIIVHLDDREMAYCKVLMDSVFGRNNYINTITITTNDPSGFKATGSKIFSTSNFLLVYGKDKLKTKINKVFIRKGYDTAYSKVFTKIEGSYKSWTWDNLKEVVAQTKGFQDSKEATKKVGKELLGSWVEKYALENPDNIFRTAAIGGGAKLKRNATIMKSKKNRNEIFVHDGEDVENFYILNGEQILFYKDRFQLVDGIYSPSQTITDIWTDISWTGIANEGGVKFKNSKKPELLMKRILDIFSNSGEVVLDSFLGSGTTCAVAHKMGRKWIGIEMGEHVYSHCIPRLNSIIDGTDKTGITKIENWQGGGGYKFYELAPSLLNKDNFGNWVISREYDADMLAEAMAKHSGFTYYKEQEIFFKQGYSTEKDFIYTTTNFLTVEYLSMIHELLKADESLLICCKAYHEECENKYSNITIKKIPGSILKKYEFGDVNYDLVVNEEVMDEEDNFDYES